MHNDLLGFIVPYTLMRLAVLIMLVLLGAFAGAVLVPSLATFLPSDWQAVKGFLTDGGVGRAFGAVTVCVGLAWVFAEDGRRRAAYGTKTAYAAAGIVLIYIFYFIPAVFRDSFAAEGRAELFYKVFYYPALWAQQVSGEFTAAVLMGMIVMMTAALGAFVTAYVRYTKRALPVNEQSKQ